MILALVGIFVGETAERADVVGVEGDPFSKAPLRDCANVLQQSLAFDSRNFYGNILCMSAVVAAQVDVGQTRQRGQSDRKLGEVAILRPQYYQVGPEGNFVRHDGQLTISVAVEAPDIRELLKEPSGYFGKVGRADVETNNFVFVVRSVVAT